VPRDRREPIVAVAVQRIPALAVGEREMQVEARALVVVPGLADERRQEALAGGVGGEQVVGFLEAERDLLAVDRCLARAN